MKYLLGLVLCLFTTNLLADEVNFVLTDKIECSSCGKSFENPVFVCSDCANHQSHSTVKQIHSTVTTQSTQVTRFFGGRLSNLRGTVFNGRFRGLLRGGC